MLTGFMAIMWPLLLGGDLVVGATMLAYPKMFLGSLCFVGDVQSASNCGCGGFQSVDCCSSVVIM